MATQPAIPSAVKLLLRQEAWFGCCACGHPFVEYHHIVPLACELHHRPKDMMVLCPNHHHQATVGAVDEKAQRQWKSDPFNRVHGLAKGQLRYQAHHVAVRIGSTLVVGNGSKLVVDGSPLLRLRVDRDRRLLVSIDLRDDDDNRILVVSDNDWITGDQVPWDIEFQHNYMRIRSAVRRVDLEIDARSEPIGLNGMLRLRKQEYRLQASGLRTADEHGGRVSIANLGLVLFRLELDSATSSLSLGPDPGFGKGSIVSAPPDELLQKSMSALEGQLRSLRIGRNKPCPCASGQKWKNCCSPG